MPNKINQQEIREIETKEEAEQIGKEMAEKVGKKLKLKPFPQINQQDRIEEVKKQV